LIRPLFFFFKSVCLLVVLSWILANSIFAANEQVHPLLPKPHYLIFNSKEPQLDFTFEYPKKWMLFEEANQGGFYSQVRLLGPKKLDTTYMCTVIIRKISKKSQGGAYEGLEDLIEDYKNHLFDDDFMNQTDKNIYGKPAKEIVATYVKPISEINRRQQIKKIIIKVRTIFMDNNDYLYEFTYSSDEKDYERQLQNFEHLLKTFEFFNERKP